MLEIRPLTVGEAVTIVPHLRKADLEEIRAGRGNDYDPEKAVVEAVIISDKAFGAWMGGELVAIYGVSTEAGGHNGYSGAVWMLGTEGIEQIPMTFLKGCKQYISTLETGFQVLDCLSDSRNTLHHKWLKWMGFEQGIAIPSLVPDVTLVHFRKVCATP